MYGLHVEVLKSDIERLQNRQIELLKEIKSIENLVEGRGESASKHSDPITDLRMFTKIMEHTGKTREPESVHIWTEILTPHNKVKGWERHHRYYSSFKKISVRRQIFVIFA